MHVGIVSHWWLPVHGGAEVYAYRLARSLQESQVTVSVFTGSPAAAQSDANGDIEVCRVGNFPEPKDLSYLDEFLESEAYRAWWERVSEWVFAQDISLVLFNKVFPSEAVKTFLSKMKLHGRKVGFIFHDADDEVKQELWRTYRTTHCWSTALDLTASAICRERERFFDNESSFLYACDFLITSSEWFGKLLSNVNNAPRYTVHPPLEEISHQHDESFTPVTVSMLNPWPVKGSLIMAHVVLYADPKWSFRVHRGGWGDKGEYFDNLIAEVSTMPGRITYVEYLKCMRAFYTSSEVFIFPSRFEGYGMAPVEAIQYGIPVVASLLPATLEGVGDGAKLVPLIADGREWLNAIEEVRSNKTYWVSQAKGRAKALIQRQQDEITGVIEFLKQIE